MRGCLCFLSKYELPVFWVMTARGTADSTMLALYRTRVLQGTGGYFRVLQGTTGIKGYYRILQGTVLKYNI